MASERCDKYKEMSDGDLSTDNHNFRYLVSRSKDKRNCDGKGIAKHWLSKVPVDIAHMTPEDRKRNLLKVE